jgi:hypothetical protein
MIDRNYTDMRTQMEAKFPQSFVAMSRPAHTARACLVSFHRHRKHPAQRGFTASTVYEAAAHAIREFRRY